jgi:predicted metal-dependent hydrolase
MERFMLHLKNNDFKPKDATILLKKSREFCSGMNVTIRDTRHAKHVIEEKIEKEKAVKDGIFFFNDERFWECHEVFEGIWKNCHGEEKMLVHGIILVAAALVHYQKDEDSICLSILGRALEKLSHSSGNYYNIDVDKLRSKVLDIRNSGKITTFEI